LRSGRGNLLVLAGAGAELEARDVCDCDCEASEVEDDRKEDEDELFAGVLTTGENAAEEFEAKAKPEKGAVAVGFGVDVKRLLEVEAGA
jgi:hypothetical protein